MVNKISLVITNVKTLEVMERWDFVVQYEGDHSVDGGPTSDKPIKQIRNEIRDIIKQITSSVTYLPLLDCLCGFDIQIHTKPDVTIPEAWGDAQPANIKNAQCVQMRSFSTNIHKMETLVTYKNDDWTGALESMNWSVEFSGKDIKSNCKDVELDSKDIKL